MSEDFVSYFNSKMNGCESPHPFWHFEPWDVGKRSREVYKLAEADLIDLNCRELMQHDLMDPHDFQSGFFLSNKPIRGLLGPTQGGKSKCPLIEISIMATGNLPISMRYDKGEDTGVPRAVSRDNILRWGRRDSVTGEVIDHDVGRITERPEGWEEWNCGNIIGIGKYPEEKLAEPGSTIWIGTTKEALNQQWWPKLTKTSMSEVPLEFFDNRRGRKGIEKDKQTIYFIGGVKLTIITYEAGYDRFEAIRTHATFLDEEPPDVRIISAAITHTKFMSITATPYRGITYLNDLLFPRKPNPALYVSHACAYDSPYLTEADIAVTRSVCPDYEIGARIWGLPTAMKGKPYFKDQRKINYWIRRWDIPYDLVRIEPDNTNIEVKTDFKTRLDPMPDERDGCTWRMYEKVKRGAAYWLTADSAEGADTEEEAGDHLSAIMFRMPEKAETKPVIVAEINTWVNISIFPYLCLCACRYYNNALLCAEGPTRGSYNALFYAEVRDYPYWYRQTTIKDATKKKRKTIGFDTNQATRKAIIDSLDIWAGEYDKDEFPEINSKRVLKQMAECIVTVKNGSPRPDHPKKGALDLVICMGQGYHVYKFYSDQIKCRREVVEKKRKISLAQSLNYDKGKPVYMGDVRI